jgi:RNA polymerase sigma-70 factor (ECF subfamily)
MSSSSATYTDVELVELARQGDRPAFDELLLRHDDRMRGLAFRLVADRHGMDDVLQDAYLNAYRGLPGFRPGSDFGRWLYRITYNCCIDEIRRRKRSPLASGEEDEPAVPASGPGQSVSTTEAVRQALADLSPGQRVTVVLVDGEGFDHHAAAEILGVAPGTVASRLYRARTKLRRTLWDVAR